ncbi:RNA polymerase sigma factor sigE, chloroplastic/mitochondrial [Hordeum vulgare subsp. vulgare]|uniref:RNA polymerase sigma factor n=1 Tax=Hordeum vulgare subsp. vulgare TaxID=112509 RepID=A0A8I6WJG0_HORVV|nr:RNA polymerase sigma factor sigE, chloroplastic/mitochondrial [Hordeum vulgare subsp. vulgare]
MTTTVTTPTPSRPLPAGPQRRRYRPTVLAIAGGSKPPRRRAPAAATSCAALAAPEKQSTATAKVAPSPAPAPSAPEGTDYDEVAATLETLYKLSPVIVEEDGKSSKKQAATKKKRKQGRTKPAAATTTTPTPKRTVVVRSQRRRRMDLGKRVEMRDQAAGKEDEHRDGERAFEEALLREHAVSTDMGSLDWRRMKIPPVLSAPQSARLFKIMQPMKAILEVQENMRSELQSEPTEAEVAEAMNMPVQRLRRLRDVGRAARNKLIKHNLRLVLYAINKYYPDMTGDERFADLCQAGANGLITAIDRFEPKRGFRISTYALFWIRHSVVRAMTLSSFTRFPFAMESERQEINRAREELSFELGRTPTDEETMKKVGLSPARYRDVVRMTRPAYSLHSRNRVTQEELINEVTDVDAIGVDTHKHNRLLRLAIDDLLDSLKPKESVVIRQRFGLDGRGRRTLSEIAGNLRISREMVRKYELKALMKLKHPTRVDYLRRYM